MTTTQNIDINVSWARPDKWITILKDGIAVLSKIEFETHYLKNEQYCYLRQEPSIIQTPDEFNEASKKIQDNSEILRRQSWYVDNLIGLLVSYESTDNAVVAEYLLDPKISYTSLARKYGVTKDRVAWEFRKLKEKIDGGELEGVREFISKRGAIE